MTNLIILLADERLKLIIRIFYLKLSELCSKFRSWMLPCQVISPCHFITKKDIRKIPHARLMWIHLKVYFKYWHEEQTTEITIFKYTKKLVFGWNPRWKNVQTCWFHSSCSCCNILGVRRPCASNLSVSLPCPLFCLSDPPNEYKIGYTFKTCQYVYNKVKIHKSYYVNLLDNTTYTKHLVVMCIFEKTEE